MDRPSDNIRDLEIAISDFVRMFELVFGGDWEMTKNCISDDCFISRNGTFINPKVDDESSNWFNRGSLLDAYRHLVEVLDNNNISHAMEDIIEGIEDQE